MRVETPNTIPLDHYIPLLGNAEIDDLRALAGPLQGRGVQMVNSTAVGGGVAEILNRLVPLIEELGIRIRWDVLEGDAKFFDVTKLFHNALQGDTREPTDEALETFRECNRRNYSLLDKNAEFTVIHDPQPAALIEARDGHAGYWTWRCHIDLSRPNPAVWKFLEQFVSRFDGTIFSSPEFSRQLEIPQYLFYPSIDPLSEKNRALEPAFIQSVLERFQIDPQRRILTQISRFDRAKDPVGVVKAYRIVKRYYDCQLVLAGGGASDDPEGAAVLAEVHTEAGNDPDIHILELPANSPLEINALQWASTIIIQKSLREGFG
ncbi:MAG: hypothetical protein WBE97_13065, partial [Candidatus Acidiferrales bacterium]